MSYVQPILSQSMISNITEYVNMYRAKNQAPPLVWDTTISSFSQEFSYQLLSTNAFAHSGTPLYGENLAMLEGYGTDILKLIKKAIDLWYQEISKYDFSNPTFSGGTGHFTCLVWKSSTNFGMGLSMDITTNKVIITMNTSPPGNVLGKFQENVLPLVSASPSPATPVAPKTNYTLTMLNQILDDLKKNRPKSKIINETQDLINKLNMSP